MGSRLALSFAAQHLPDAFEQVELIFTKKGAYGRFKGLLESRGKLDQWYAFEAEAQRSALRDWCEENEIPVEG